MTEPLRRLNVVLFIVLLFYDYVTITKELPKCYKAFLISLLLTKPPSYH